jgi:hypothetical protein
MNLTFTKATKQRAKMRLAIDGPSGAGKTYTAMVAATALAEGGKIAVIDTERGSASLYSDKFDFDVLELTTFNPQLYIDAIDAAEKAGYAVIVIDSLSHAWEGEGGALEMVDQAAAAHQGNSYVAWKNVTPLQRHMVDAMLQSPCHIIATMRSKMDYIQETDERGKKVVRKIGMAPVQRQGMEYEFTIVADMDTDHNFIVSKTRCDLITDKVVKKPDVKFFETILAWLNSGEPAPAPAPAPAPDKSLKSPDTKPDTAAVTDRATLEANWPEDAKMSFASASLVVSSGTKTEPGKPYIDLSNEELIGRVNGLKDRLKKTLGEAELNDTRYRLDVIDAILKARILHNRPEDN